MPPSSLQWTTPVSTVVGTGKVGGGGTRGVWGKVTLWPVGWWTSKLLTGPGARMGVVGVDPVELVFFVI